MPVSDAMGHRVVWAQRPHRKRMSEGLGKKEQAPVRTRRGDVQLAEPVEASERLGTNSKTKLRPMLAASCVQGPTRLRSQRFQEKLIIPDSSKETRWPGGGPYPSSYQRVNRRTQQWFHKFKTEIKKKKNLKSKMAY